MKMNHLYPNRTIPESHVLNGLFAEPPGWDGRDTFCSLCDAADHVAKNCPELLCYTCRQQGHLTKVSRFYGCRSGNILPTGTYRYLPVLTGTVTLDSRVSYKLNPKLCLVRNHEPGSTVNYSY
jgi:hypothetical protein